MYLYLFPNISSPLLLIILTIFLFHVPNSLSFDDERYLNCSQSFECSNLESIGYPFWGANRPEYCGFPDFKLNCSGDTPSISIQEQEFRVLSVNQRESSLTVARVDFWNNVCPAFPTNTTTIDNSSSRVLEYASDVQQLLLFYACPLLNRLNIYLPPQLTSQFNCTLNSTTDYINYYAIKDLSDFGIFGECSTNVTVRVSQSAASNLALNASKENLGAALDSGFGLKWDASNNLCEQCQGSGGQCGYNTSSGGFSCYCKDGPKRSNCGGSTSISSLVWIIGILAGVFGTIVLIVCCISRKRILVLFNKDERDEFDIEAFIRNHKSLSPKRYNYSDLKKMTNSFKDQIGKGGYGTVYKGKLPNGLVVAVKVLSESKGNGEEFINEVASIGRTSHVNIVTLVGFCYEGEKTALIYEYMPNGSLDKFIHYKQGSSDESCRLEWITLSEIAVGIARGLEYLHRGCNTRILHFDIKPQNILLDKDFCPKISDFGLAKLCMTKESIVSMLGTRGTAGYIAPEVFSRNFGGVSHKSDVYSYGMLVLEMVGARKNLDSEVSHTSEMFPHYIYKDLELEKNEIISGEITEDESKIARKMILISLGCIQTLPSDRPSMSKVVEMLEGPLHSLPIPPKPFLFSEEESAPMSQPSETG
ncbi:LEAF RUST 10 DISEASE-RESISTANCE LOCUS RECEPTOR-LIKE PROTEIN KINASE-like 2.5 [Rosa sericea]